MAWKLRRWQYGLVVACLAGGGGCGSRAKSLTHHPKATQDHSPQAVALQAFCTEISEGNMAAAAAFVAGGEADSTAPSRFPSLLHGAALKVSDVQLTPAGFSTEVNFNLSFGAQSTDPHQRDRQEAVTMVDTPAGWKIFPPHTVTRDPNRLIAIAAYELTPAAIEQTKDDLAQGLKAIAIGVKAYVNAHGGILPQSSASAGADLLPFLPTGPLALNPSENVPSQVVYSSADGRRRVQSAFAFNPDLAGKPWKESPTPMFTVGTAQHPFLIGPYRGYLTEAGKVVWAKR